ncbi:MAG TPA: lipopolysaccharide biosynthesis protein [Thiobacillaceae bacterium]|nr:lipopolysaccharide biosynthesis protein [Thiobacillaceae bacterium]
MSETGAHLGKKIRQGTRWTLAGSLANEVIQFAVSIVLARLLLPAEFGLVATVGIVTGLAGYFAGAGTGQALVRAKEADARHFNVVFTLQLLIGCAIYLFFVVLAPFFARFFEQSIYQSLLLVSGLNFFLRPFANLPTARLQRAMNFRPLVIINAVTLVATSAVSIGMALAGHGVWSLVIGGLVGALLRGLLLNLHVGERYALTWDRAIVRDLGSYGVKVAANSLIEHFRGQSMIFILSKFNGPGDVGLYNRAASLAAMPMRIVGTSPYQAIFRALAAEQDNLDRSRYLYYRTITLVATYTLPLYVLAWWLAEPGVRFIYGEKWIGSAEPLTILALGGLFSCIGNPSGAVVEARNRMTAETKLNIIAWTLLVAGVLYGLQWGLAGVAWASLLTTVFFNTGLAVVAGREIQGSPSALGRALRPALVLNGLMLAALWLADAALPPSYLHDRPGTYAFLMSAIGGAAYLAAFLFLPIGELKSESTKWRGKLRLYRR